VSLCVFLLSLQGSGSVKCIPPFGPRQRLGKHVPAATNTRNNRRNVGRVILYAVRVLSKESLWVCLRIPLLLLGKTRRCSRNNEELLEASLPVRSVSYQRKVGY
jgi:hypothetical protein